MLLGDVFAVADPSSATLCIVVVGDYLQPSLEQLAAHFANRRQLWIPFKPGGTEPFFGPLIASHDEDAGCYFCLARRMAEHRPGDRVLAAPPEGIRPAKGWTRASLAVAHALAAIEL